MKSPRWILAIALLIFASFALAPAADAAPKKEGGTFTYYGGWEMGLDLEDPLFSDLAVCNITCANGSRHKTEADDMEECVADCNEVCNTTSCRPA